MKVVLDHIFIDAFRKARQELDVDSDDFESWQQLRKFFTKGNISTVLAEENVPVYPEELQVLLKDINSPLPFSENQKADGFKLNPTAHNINSEASTLFYSNPYLLYFVSFKNELTAYRSILSSSIETYISDWNKLSLKNKEIQLRVHPKMTSKNVFDNWDTLNEYSLPSNSVILTDSYLSSYKRKENICYNAIELIKHYLNNNSSENKFITILTTHSPQSKINSEEIYDLIKLAFPSPDFKIQLFSFLAKAEARKMKLFDYPVMRNDSPIHYRYFFTNYFAMKCEAGFELLSKTKNGNELRLKNTELDFSPYVIDSNERQAYYHNAKAKIQDYKKLIEECRLDYKEQILFLGDEFENPLFNSGNE